MNIILYNFEILKLHNHFYIIFYEVNKFIIIILKCVFLFSSYGALERCIYFF